MPDNLNNLFILKAVFVQTKSNRSTNSRCYLASEMEGVSAKFPELENVPSSQIFLTEASRLQSLASASNKINRRINLIILCNLVGPVPVTIR